MKDKPPTKAELRAEAKARTEMIDGALEAIAENIEEWAALGKKMIDGSRLRRRAILVLLKDALPGVNIGDIDAVLYALPDLRRRYLK